MPKRNFYSPFISFILRWGELTRFFLSFPFFLVFEIIGFLIHMLYDLLHTLFLFFKGEIRFIDAPKKTNEVFINNKNNLFKKLLTKVDVLSPEYTTNKETNNLGKESEKSEDNYLKTNDILSLLVKEKSEITLGILIDISIYTIIYLSLCFFRVINYSSLVILFFVFSFILILINYSLFKYRVKKGYFGNNFHEAKEILYYIFSNSKNDDFTNGNGKREIFPVTENEFVSNDAILQEGEIKYE